MSRRSGEYWGYEEKVSVVRLIAVVFAALSCNAFAAADLYVAINRLRAGQGACMVAQKPAPLTRQPALERAALGLSR
jgi:hypothetical protein